MLVKLRKVSSTHSTGDPHRNHVVTSTMHRKGHLPLIDKHPLHEVDALSRITSRFKDKEMALCARTSIYHFDRVR